MKHTEQAGDSPTVRLTLAYEAAYRYFRAVLFFPVLGESLPDPVLTFSRCRKKKAISFFARETWKPQSEPEHRISEIALVPEQTGGDPRELMSHLVREMAHFADHLAGNAPKSPGYHGRRWFERMAKLGLPAKPTSPKSRIAVVHAIDPDGPFAQAYRAMPAHVLFPFTGAHPNKTDEASNPISEGENASRHRGKKSTMHGKRQRYECPRCLTTMRGPAGRSVICGDCNVPYATESPQHVLRDHIEAEDMNEACV